MSRKIFISFLGTGGYSNGHYSHENFKSPETRFIQVATLQYINDHISKWQPGDKAVILLTKDAEKRNWEDYGAKDKDGYYYRGLKGRLEDLNYPISITPIRDVPTGGNENEILDIFSLLFKSIDDGDQLYIDVTHGFRSLPMLVIVFGNYAKFLKKDLYVKSITYGAYEARKGNVSPIVDLQVLSSLQDWTFAAADYLENGNAGRLASLAQENVKPLLVSSQGKDKEAQAIKALAEKLKNATDDMLTCRGMNIINGTNIYDLQRSLSEIKKSFIPQLNPLLKKIEHNFSNFTPAKNILNGIEAAQWCVDNAMYQQAATLLQETVVSFFSSRHGIAIDDEENRGLINIALNIIAEGKQVKLDEWKVDENKKETLKHIIETDSLMHNAEIVSAFSSLTDVRNDMNHSGMRSTHQPMKPSKIKTRVNTALKVLSEILLNHGSEED